MLPELRAIANTSLPVLSVLLELPTSGRQARCRDSILTATSFRWCYGRVAAVPQATRRWLGCPHELERFSQQRRTPLYNVPQQSHLPKPGDELVYATEPGKSGRPPSGHRVSMSRLAPATAVAHTVPTI